MPETSWRRRWNWLYVPLSLAALGWTVWLLWGSLPELRANLPRLKLGWLLFVFLGSTISSYLGFESYRALFNHVRPGLYSRKFLAHLYFTSQLMKHLPGRIWGVTYQSVRGRGATLSEWASVTAAYMMLTTGFALWVAATVLGVMHGWLWGVLAVTVGGAIYVFAWRRRQLTALLATVRKIRLRAVAKLCDALQPLADADGRLKGIVWGWFVASWLIYLLAWAGYGMAWPGLTAVDGVWLCAIYTIAWFAGYISLLSPSGLGVRELVFVLLAHRFPPDAVAGMAVLGRVVLLCVDLVLGAIFIAVRDSR